ncbi:tyrosine-type recombinase/integrase [Phaeobacter inhibens]|uniref:tyrosine-type recombinase/integrase n=1 Tax=Phaeobacter inhibens TaxID=221822 RepID=UPI000C9A6ADB|nr:tyrosine-type recombinase/integrase [Phaeobacter inhibens]AUQ55162.1 phase integrase-like protein [Phaeobacter inhibens]AUQ79178.1 phase integrase-like protein [Phaeobacter inhibens]AUR16337.1 phase integrase-like protein [Phaeobacter inhibens]
MRGRRNPFPGVGNQPSVDRHGKKRWRLRKTIKGRKVDTYLPGAYGSVEFRLAYDAAVNPVSDVPKTRGAEGTIDYVVSHYRGNQKFTVLAPSTRYGKGKRLDWICQLIGPARLADLETRHIENLMDRKGGPDAANRLLKELSELFEYARKRLGMNIRNPTVSVDRRKTRNGGYHTWTVAEVKKFRDHHPSGTMARLALELMLATGAARQDACGMGRHNIKGDVIYYRRGKTGQDTEMPLAYMPNLVAEIVQLPPDASVFLTHSNGKTYTVESFGNWFRDQCVAAGLPDNCRAHGLRKHGATELAEAGANEFQIMAFLAHKSTHEALRYVRAAQRKKLASDALALARTENVSNLSEWLGKSTAQDAENKVK